MPSCSDSQPRNGTLFRPGVRCSSKCSNRADGYVGLRNPAAEHGLIDAKIRVLVMVRRRPHTSITSWLAQGWVRRTPDPADGRYTLAILTGEGWSKITETAPGHVESVRRLGFDQLTKAQSRQLRDICRRIVRAVDPDDRCLEDPPPGTTARTVPAASTPFLDPGLDRQ